MIHYNIKHTNMTKKKDAVTTLQLTTKDGDNFALAKKPRFVTIYNWDKAYSIYNAKPYGRSRTVPGQSMTVEQIYQRYASGQPVSAYKDEPVFHGDFPMPNFDKMDKIDREKFRLENARYIAELREKVEAAEKERNAVYAAEQKAQYEAKLKEDAIKEHLSAKDKNE